MLQQKKKSSQNSFLLWLWLFLEAHCSRQIAKQHVGSHTLLHHKERNTKHTIFSFVQRPQRKTTDGQRRGSSCNGAEKSPKRRSAGGKSHQIHVQRSGTQMFHGPRNNNHPLGPLTAFRERRRIHFRAHDAARQFDAQLGRRRFLSPFAHFHICQLQRHRSRGFQNALQQR